MTKQSAANSIFMAILLVSTQVESSSAQTEKHHWFFPNHPKLRRIIKAAGLGAATGGIAAPFLGASAAAGAAAGAGEHAALRSWKDQHDSKRHRKLDNHVW